MKRICKNTPQALLLVLLCIILVLSSCSGEGGKKKEIDTAKIASTLSQKTPTDSKWINEDQTFLKEYTLLPKFVKSSAIYYAQDTNNLDEFGVFWIEEGKAKAVRQQIAIHKDIGHSTHAHHGTG